ncbi:nitrogen fixation protein NifX [Natronobacillus azotifigens]|uniref:NifB/NifX family molybdenum-iron cluster-binding protein n=1 Tax=Natronobacillus azotifigens TaxID=472978 RepID=A0A9J6RDD3_9BACI|nr:NifB/NifX family molybdenum-iron cluster-binding protein [Natronobacillus azotifigens]MCZ0703738.1 NifB/NifX family molybdenum-iron cluster-binding protein [Natronobacillus azotifigens]
MKVGFSSSDGITVNSHFGYAEIFSIYNIDHSQYEPYTTRVIEEVNEEDEIDKIETRLNAVKDCTILFITQIGPAAAARVTREKIMPVKVQEGTLIKEQLDRLLIMLQNKPPLWLQKLLNEQTANE